eukprot:gene47264-61253_t
MSLNTFRTISNSLRQHAQKSWATKARFQVKSPSVKLLSRSFGSNVLAATAATSSGSEQMQFSPKVWMHMLAAVAGVTLFSNLTAENCGIVGVVGGDDASGFLLEGLTILRNRGYDSAGIATIPREGEEIFVTKYASRESTADSIDLVRSNSSKH